MPHVESESMNGLLELLEFFEGHLADAKFPDVSTAALREGQGRVVNCHAEAERLEQELVEAKTRLDEAQRDLLGKAKKGLAYAKVFAAEEPQQMKLLGNIRLNEGKATPKKRRSQKAQGPIQALSSDEEKESDTAVSVEAA